MSSVILNNIPFELDTGILMKKLHIDPESEDAMKISGYAKEANKVGNPKVLYKPAYIESRKEDSVVVEDIKFASHILSINLKEVCYIKTSALLYSLQILIIKI